MKSSLRQPNATFRQCSAQGSLQSACLSSKMGACDSLWVCLPTRRQRKVLLEIHRLFQGFVSLTRARWKGSSDISCVSHIVAFDGFKCSVLLELVLRSLLCCTACSFSEHEGADNFLSHHVSERVFCNDKLRDCLLKLTSQRIDLLLRSPRSLLPPLSYFPPLATDTSSLI